MPGAVHGLQASAAVLGAVASGCRMSAKPQSIRNRSEESEEGARPYEASAVCKSVTDRVDAVRITHGPIRDGTTSSTRIYGVGNSSTHVRYGRVIVSPGAWRTDTAPYGAHTPSATALSRLVALRLHVNDSQANNGPLRVLPGTRVFGVLSATDIERFIRKIPPVDCLVSASGTVVACGRSSCPRRPRQKLIAPPRRVAPRVRDSLDISRTGSASPSRDAREGRVSGHHVIASDFRSRRGAVKVSRSANRGAFRTSQCARAARNARGRSTAENLLRRHVERARFRCDGRLNRRLNRGRL